MIYQISYDFGTPVYSPEEGGPIVPLGGQVVGHDEAFMKEVEYNKIIFFI